MILLALGGNLPSPRFGPPRATLEAALRALEHAGVRVERRSRWYESAPQPPSDQPWFVNGVARLQTSLSPGELLALLHRIEADFGRVRGARDAPRVIDLDLLDHNGRVSRPGESPVLPHPRVSERLFVLLPLLEVAPDWRHPATGESARALARRLQERCDGQACRPLDEGAGRGTGGDRGGP